VVADNLQEVKFKKVSDKDRASLSSLLDRDLKFSNEWWKLDSYWLKKYTYSLRVQLIYDFIGNLIIPSGKEQGKTFKLNHAEQLFIKDIYNPTRRTANQCLRIVRRAILSLARKNGKGLALDTPIPTPSGWKTMADIKEGDCVYGRDGKPVNVSFVSDVHYNLRCWKLTFSDGSFVVADEDHQWVTSHRYRPWVNTRINGSGSGGKYVSDVVTTPQIAQSVKIPRPDGINENNHKIECAKSLESENIPLPIPPYFLGLWLGDGNSCSPQITCGDQDIDFMLGEIIRDTGIKATVSRCKDRSATIHVTDGIKNRTKPCLQKDLRRNNLLQNKHIPEIYFSAGKEQRWALLQGLMDTDGTVTKCGGQTTARCSFTTIRHDLATGVWRLARSLGLKATIHERDAKMNGRIICKKYDVAFPASQDNKIFRLYRKQCLVPESLGKRSGTITIVSCEEVETFPTKCIQVDSSDKIFLCGHGCIPTHNTALIGTLVLVHLVGPEAIVNGEIYSAANDRDQASIVFKYAAQIVRADAELGAYVKIIDSTKTMLCYSNGSIYRAVSAEAGTKMGLNPTVWIYDELAQAKNRDLYDAFDTAGGAREEQLGIIISTQSNDPQHILSQLIDDGIKGKDPSTVCHLYEIPEDKDVFDEKNWPLANPALGDFRSLTEMRTAAARAKRMPSFEAAFRNLYCNQRTSATSPFIPRAEWEACFGDSAIECGEGIYLGLDLSGKTDLTALIGVSGGERDRVRAWFWKPKESLIDHEKRDRVPYTVWEKQGFIKTTPGRAVQYSFIAQELAEITRIYTIIGMAFDRYRIDDLMNAMQEIGLDCYVDGKDKPRAGAMRLVPWGQGYASMTQAVEALEVSVLERKLVHDGQPCLTWNISNAMAISDAAGNRKLDKAATRFRIDGAVALAMAEGLKSRDLKGAPQKSSYEGLSVEEIVNRLSL